MLLQVIPLIMAIPRVEAACFDFKSKVSMPLKGEPPLIKGGDSKKTGPLPSGAHWGEVKGEIKKPIRKVLDLLLDHNNTKSPKIDEMKVEKQSDPHYLERHLVTFTVKPFPFINISWKEQWVYALTEGTSDSPKKIVISYEKIEGTSHIEHLCGSIVLRKLSPDSIDIYEYEEAKATRRSSEDTMNGLLSTLAMLRKG